MSNTNMRRSCWNETFMFSGKEIKPPIYFLLPVCAAGCSWPACGRPADCWSHFSWPSSAFWLARRSPPSHRWGRSPRSRSAPLGRSGLAAESVEWLDYERREQCKLAECWRNDVFIDLCVLKIRNSESSRFCTSRAWILDNHCNWPFAKSSLNVT